MAQADGAVGGFTHLMDLASERLGGKAISANDEFFAPKDNLLKPEAPVFIPGKFTEFGKWMDGWETRRRREPGHDWCIIRLGVPGIIHGFTIDTAHFKGNQPESCTVEATEVRGPDGRLDADRTAWTTVLERTPLNPGSEHGVAASPAAHGRRFTHVRLNIFPDGGVARLRVLGEVLPDWPTLAQKGGLVDLAAAENAGLVIACNDMHFGSRHNLIMPGRALNMGDGWETRRRRGPGYDWTIIRLGHRGTIRKIEVDTNHFKGNFPESCMIEVCDAPGIALESLTGSTVRWTTLLPRTKLAAHTRHHFERELATAGPATHARLNIYPDGGISRLRLHGTPEVAAALAAPPSTSDPAAGAGSGLDRLNALSKPEALAAFHRCCGSRRWASRMVDGRPFDSAESVHHVAQLMWFTLDREDWLEAFAQHPRIGASSVSERALDQPIHAQTAALAAGEQSGMAGASDEVRRAFTAGNELYEQHFGHVFLIRATGRSAEEMLSHLHSRLKNEPDVELSNAAAQQAEITRIRLETLLA